MRPESRSALTHILEAAREIRLVSAGKTIAEYEADRHLRAIVGFRNVLVHGYDVVDEEQVWAAVTDELEYLIATAEGLLED